MPHSPRTKLQIPTPALLVDLDRLDANLRHLADHCKQRGVNLRPHAKTHKCPELARRQLEAGAIGISVATVPEAEAMVQAGIRGVLLTSPLTDPLKVARMVDLTKHGRDVMLAVGHELEVELLAAAAASMPTQSLGVLIDLDVGDRRSGVLPGETALNLARRIGQHRPLRLLGLQAYAGHASHTVGFAERARVSRLALGQAVATRNLLTQAGIETSILSCGSTGTYNIDSDIPGVTELQCGSYVFMDIDYRRIGGREEPRAYGDFQFSLTVLATVISATHRDRVTVDAGIKAFSTDTALKPEVVGRHELIYTRTGDEFGALTAANGVELPKLGERLEFRVPHCDPTTNLYDRLYAVRGEEVEAVWPILARRET